jgi:hypothetical protein
LFPWYERRTWRLQHEDSLVHQKVLFVSPKTELMLSDSLVAISGDLFYYQNSSKTTLELIHETGMTVPPI